MITDDMVEKAARAMIEALAAKEPETVPWDKGGDDEREEAMMFARAALTAALGDAVVVPAEISDSDMNLVMGRDAICPQTPASAILRRFYNAIVKHYGLAVTRHDHGGGS